MSTGTGGAPRRRRAPLLLVSGLILLTAAGVAVFRSGPEPTVGAPAVVALASAPPVSRPATVPAEGPAEGPATVPVPDEVAPVRLRIPALELTATVAAVGVDPETGDFAVPPSVDRVGWYRFGPGLTAAAGSIVVAGHVDGAGQGRGAFFGLGELDPGDAVVLTGPGGADRRFTVVGGERFQKTRIPLDRYFARDGAPRLTLITCGGPFDERTGHYRDNVVVTAWPA